MDKYIMVGCDLHDANMLLKIAEGRGKGQKRVYENTVAGREAMREYLGERARLAGGGVMFAYEASCQGFGLYDEMRAAGFTCHVLAPTKIARSVQQRRRKTDERDADRILELLRGHVLAGNDLPTVWVPDLQTRDEREVVRARLDAALKRTVLKAQVRTLLKRNGVRKPVGVGEGWTRGYLAWLEGLLKDGSVLGAGARMGLGTLWRQMEAIEGEMGLLDQEVEALSRTARYEEPVEAICRQIKGVGLLTAMVYLTEMGDLSRFHNRKAVGAFLGLTPSSDETGETGDRKGHITHQGPWRVRRVLCQATWSRVRTDGQSKAVYERMVRKNPKHKKIAVAGMMRRLAILLWHVGQEAQRRGRCFEAAAQRVPA